MNNLSAPAHGERWIADTEVRGFGVRMWSGNSKGKSYAIRVKDKNGKMVRETIYSVREGSLEYVRNLALIRINELKGTQTSLTFRERMRMKWKIKLRNMSLDDLASLAAELQIRSSVNHSILMIMLVDMDNMFHQNSAKS